MRQFKALLQIPEGSIDKELILAVYHEDQALGSLGHCAIRREGDQLTGTFELTDNVSEHCHLRFIGHVDASKGIFIPERLLITSANEKGAMPISALIMNNALQS